MQQLIYLSLLPFHVSRSPQDTTVLLPTFILLIPPPCPFNTHLSYFKYQFVTQTAELNTDKSTTAKGKALALLTKNFKDLELLPFLLHTCCLDYHLNQPLIAIQ